VLTGKLFRKPSFHELASSYVRFQVLTAESMKMTVFWDVAPCSLVENDRNFGSTHCLHHQGYHPTRPNVGAGLARYRAYCTCLHSYKQETSTPKEWNNQALNIGHTWTEKILKDSRLSAVYCTFIRSCNSRTVDTSYAYYDTVYSLVSDKEDGDIT
jgi:hypothetical protein